ncbi:hypothetical protein M3Y99_00449100 [Aphelenchoides fujianensis]|nr:hypothetical protein M3Y99_00449100 [Aphelenchoides fujianensis]
MPPATVTAWIHFEYCFMFGACVSTAISQSHLLIRIFQTPVRKQISPHLLLNIFLWILVALAGIWHAGYMALASGDYYSTVLVLTSGAAMHSVVTPLSVSVFFLLLERVMILGGPGNVFQRHKRRLLVVNALVCFGVWFYVFFFTMLMETPVEEEFTNCTTFACVNTHSRVLYGQYIKVGNCLCNAVLAVAFAFKIAAYRRRNPAASNARNFKQANRIAAWNCVGELLFNALPHFTNILSATLHFTTWSTLGPYGRFLQTVDGLITAFFYRLVLQKQVNSASKTSAVLSGNTVS